MHSLRKARRKKAREPAVDTPYVAAVRAWFRARIVLLPPESPEWQKTKKARARMKNSDLFGAELNKAQKDIHCGRLHDELDGGIPVKLRSAFNCKLASVLDAVIVEFYPRYSTTNHPWVVRRGLCL